MKRKKPITIFIVDNDELLTSALKQEIEQMFILQPVSISVFLTGAQCELFMKHKPDLVIIDFDANINSIDAVTGLSTISRIKAPDSRTHVLMLARNETAEVAVEALKNNVHDYIIKNNFLFKKLKLSLMQCITIIELRRNMKEQVNLGILTFLVVVLMVSVVVGVHVYAPTSF